MDDAMLYALLPVLIGTVIGLLIAGGTRSANQKVVEDLKAKLDTVAKGDTLEEVIRKVGNPQGKDVKDDRVIVYWDVHSQQKVLYRRGLEFVNNRFTIVIYEDESL